MLTGYKMEIEEQIKGSILHVLNFMIRELLKQCFKLAFKKELSDLKGLVRPDSICYVTEEGYVCCGVELELLEILDDEPIKQMLVSIDQILDCIDRYLMINNLDMEELLEEQIHEQNAYESISIYVYKQKCNGSYKTICKNINAVYLTFEQVLYHCAHQFIRGKLDVFDGAFDFFWEQNDRLETDDQNALLLLDLMKSLRYNPHVG